MKICVDINSFSRASQVLLKKNARVFVLLGSDEIKRTSGYFKKYIDEGNLILLDVRGLSTDEVINKILKNIGEK